MRPGPRLELDGPPAWVTMPLLPEHRILRVHLRNAGDAPVELRRTRLRLLDEGGQDLRAVARPPLLRLEPGQSAALDLVYRSGGEPARLEHAGLGVALPRQGRPA